MTTQETGAPVANAEVPAHVPEWVMIARAGRWLGHPAGPEVITPEGLGSALAHFNRHYRANGSEMVIDYHHASVFAARAGGPQAPAAGWIREAELRADGTELWGRVLWTGTGRRAVAEREFRYLSPVLMFNRPDGVTGERVPLHVHSVALTNTPFMTELEALNANPATDGGAGATLTEGGGEMPILKSIAEALDRTPEQVASTLGLEGAGADEAETAEAILALAERPAAGVVLNALGLEDGATLGDALAAVAALKGDEREEKAEELVNGAVADGRVPPAQRDFWLNAARADYGAAAAAIDNLAPVIAAPCGGGPARPGRALTDAEEGVRRQLGLSAEAFLNAL